MIMYYVKAYFNNGKWPSIIDCLPYAEAVIMSEDIPGSWVELCVSEEEVDRACEREVNRGI